MDYTCHRNGGRPHLYNRDVRTRYRKCGLAAVSKMCGADEFAGWQPDQVDTAVTPRCIRTHTDINEKHKLWAVRQSLVVGVHRHRFSSIAPDARRTIHTMAANLAPCHHSHRVIIGTVTHLLLLLPPTASII